MMLSRTISECLSNRTGSYLIPLLWYTGESAELVRKEMDAIRQAGISSLSLKTAAAAGSVRNRGCGFSKKFCNTRQSVGCASGCWMIPM